MALNFSSSLSALQASQIALNTIANNIANANTPGYHRQNVTLADNEPVFLSGFWTGTGVHVSSINQIASRSIENALTRNISDLRSTTSQLTMMRQIEANFAPGEGSLDDALKELFGEIQNLQGQPDDSSQRQLVVGRAVSFTNKIRSISNDLNDLRKASLQEIRQSVDLVNNRLESLAVLNRRISQAQANGQQPNDLLDQHQQLVNQIAESIDIEVINKEIGFNYQFAGDSLSLSQSNLNIQLHVSLDREVTYATESGFPLDFHGGELAALQQSHNQSIPSYQAQLEQFTETAILAFDRVHSTGISINGGFQLLTSHRQVSDPTIPLSTADLPFEIQNGELFISVTDHQSGTRSLHSVAIDPENQSLEDLATAIRSIDNLQVIVNQQTGTMTIRTNEGFSFDFAGRIETFPDRSNIAGDAEIRFSGQYHGSTNDEWSFSVSGTGDVGITDGLLLLVENQQGEVVSELNIGLGYEPGSRIEIAEGVFITIDSGTFQDTDQFSTKVISDSDNSDVLVALGLNTFFQGSRAGGIRVNSMLVDNPNYLASSRSGHPGDANNAQRLYQLHDQILFPEDRTIVEYLQSITSRTAIEVVDLNDLATTYDQAQKHLTSERQALSGVDPNEEMVNMLKFQRAFQAAVRVITSIDETMSELMNIIR